MYDKKLLKALILAKDIIDYCQGDKWERECTEKERIEFDKIYYEIFPEKKEETIVKEITYCNQCKRNFINHDAYLDHIKKNKKHNN